MRNVSDKSCRENQNTPFMFSNSFWKLCSLWDNREQYCRPRQATDDNITRRMHTACWITKATYTLRIWNTYCFSMTTMVMWMCLMLHLYIHCLTCYLHLTMYYLGSFWYQIHGILFGQKLNLVNKLENYKISTQSLNHAWNYHTCINMRTPEHNHNLWRNGSEIALFNNSPQ